MSVRASLESIFSHLFTEPEPEEGEGEAPPPPPAAEAEPEPPAAEETGAGEAAEAPAAAAEPVVDDPLLHYAGIPYSVRVKQIDDELDVRQVRNVEANEHLDFQRDRAAKKDAAVILAKDYEYGREQRKTGLPPIGSQLDLNVEMLHEHGLLHPRGIITRVQRERAARSCEQEGTIDIAAEEAKSRPPPHYMKTTGCYTNQMEAKAQIIGTVRSLRELKLRNQQEVRRCLPAPPPSPPPTIPPPRPPPARPPPRAATSGTTHRRTPAAPCRRRRRSGGRLRRKCSPRGRTRRRWRWRRPRWSRSGRSPRR